MTKKLLLTILQLQLLAPALFAAVPIRWTVESSRVQPAQFDAYHGETLDLEATFLSYGLPLALPPDADCRIFWQTNGMGNVYWSTNAVLVSSNAIAAVFQPTFDPGATTVLGFIGIPASNYRAAFTIRFRGSPGATPFNPPPFPMAEYYTKPEVDSRISSATNAIRRVDGAARPLPPYLHALDFDDTYPEDAAWYYAQPQDYGQCSSVRDGNSFARNYDWKFDRAAEFVVRMSAGPGRFASVGVANCGTNLTEEIATGGKWSRYFKCLPGRTVDGINENGVVANVNVVSGVPSWQTGDGLHPLAAVRWVLDNATSAASAAQHLAEHIRFPAGWTQNFHWMIADATETWNVENGAAHKVTGRAAMTNFPLYPTRGSGEGQERYDALMGGSNITSQWWTLTYTPGGYRASDLPGIDSNLVFAAWASEPRESHRGETFGDVAWWQTVHTSVYDITIRTLRIAVQERDDWYVFSVPQGGKVKSVNGRTGDVVLAGEDVISDLATIRSGAAAGATAVQPASISDMETQTHAAQTYQPKGQYLTSETDPSVADWAKKPNPAPVTDLTPAISYTTAVSNKLESSKQPVISDLATIRSGAALGATALQSYTESDPSVADWAKKPNPAPVTDLTPAISYTTAVSNKLESSKQPVISDLATIRSGAALGATALQSFTESDPTVSSAISTHNSSTSAHNDIRTALAGKQDTISDLATIRSGAALGATALQSFTETDPTVSSAISTHNSSTSAHNDLRTSIAAKYSKPSGGIPKTDLASAVQTSLGKADTALQSYTETDPTVAAALAPVTNTVNAWQTYWDGDDVRVTVTNYYGTADLPRLYLEQKISEGGTNYFKKIWSETSRLDVITNRIAELEADVATKADRAWGFYDSHSGSWAPDGFTSISSESILISKDMSYQKTVTSAGEVWVLTATDPTVITGTETNGFFRISDSEGNSVFEIVKGDKRTVPATCSAVIAGNNSLTITYNVIAAEHPAIEICDGLEEQNWIAEGEAGCPATVVWSGSSGAWIATVTGTQTMPKMFVKGTYEVGGETYARHGVPLGFEKVVIGGVYYRVDVETVNGRKLMVLTEL